MLIAKIQFIADIGQSELTDFTENQVVHDGHIF